MLSALAAPNFLLKIIPHVDGSPRALHFIADLTLELGEVVYDYLSPERK